MFMEKAAMMKTVILFAQERSIHTILAVTPVVREEKLR